MGPARAVIRASLAALVAVLLAAPALAAPAPAAPAPAGAHRWSVGADSPREASAVAARLRERGFRVRPIPRIGAMEVVVTAGTADPPAALRAERGVEWVEPVRLRTLSAEPAEAVDPTTGRPFGWAYDTVGAAGALAQVGGSRAPVAVVDSGLDVGHPDLAGRIGAARDVLTGGTAVTDLVGHGTFVAGLIAAVDGNGIGGRGVAGATAVLPVRVTTTGIITSTAAAAGIVWAVDNGARVVNLSFGGPGLSSAEAQALEYARARDVLVVASSGNGAQVGNPVEYPAAALGGVRGGWGAGLSVGATDPLGRPAPFSTHNDFVSIAAPGAGLQRCVDGVHSTIPREPSEIWDSGGCARSIGTASDPGGRYGYGEGTSFSTPLVAGAAALVREANPALRAEQAADVLRRSARQTVGAGWNPSTGAGILDMTAAVSLARRYDTAAPEPVLSVISEGGALVADLSGREPAPPGAEVSGLASLQLDGSADGASFSPLAPAQASSIRSRVEPGPGAPRWFRGTACDVNRNCASVVRGPSYVVPAPASPGRAVASARPRLRLIGAGRPARCGRGRPRGACSRVVFRVAGAPAAWTVVVRERGVAGRLGRRSGRTGAGRTVTTLVPLRRRPVCGRRIVVSVTVSGGGVRERAVRRLSVRRPCALAPGLRRASARA